MVVSAHYEFQEEADNRKKKYEDSEEEYDEESENSSDANESADEPFQRPPVKEEPKHPVLL